MKFPRLLPLIAVAIGGVLAVNAMAGAGNMTELLSGARAFAEETVAKVAPKAAEKAAEPKIDEKAAAPLPEGRLLGDELSPKAQSMVCAPSSAELAREAGLSPNELQLLQSLGARRGQIESLEKNVDVQQQMLLAAEGKVDAKIATMRSLIADMQALLGQADEKQKADNARLVKIYEGMKPKDAAPVLATMDDSVRLDIAAGMKERNLSAILGAMPAPAARELTEKLARRYAASAVTQAARDAIAPTQTAAAKGPAPKAATPPAPKAAAPKQAPAAAPKQAAAPPAAPPPATPPAQPPAKSG